MKKLLCGVFVGFVGLCCFARGEEDVVRRALVKIYAIQSSPDFYNPWSMRGPRQVTGSGCVVSKRRILTNAHVVSDRTYVQVRKQGDPRRFEARVLSVSHDADLALLEVADGAFWEDTEALPLGVLPEAQADVLVYGFPLGGDTMSVTKGVVSRIEHRVYAHSSSHLLAGQIDNAINGGNSGGPVVQGGKIVGVVMQALTQAENIGYMVPVSVVRHFLEDLEDGRYDGFPSMGVVLQNMENPDLKARFGMPEEESGLLITRVLPGAPAEGVLKVGDVVLRIGTYDVADDGTVAFRAHERTSASHAVQELQVGASVPVMLWRDGGRVAVEVSLARRLQDDRLIELEQYDRRPAYFIYGGLVFCPLTKDLLEAWGSSWYNHAPKDLVAMLGDNLVVEERDEVVVLLKVLAGEVNKGYHGITHWVVEEVDGKPVRSLRGLIEQVEEGDGVFMELRNSRGQVIALRRERAVVETPKILEIYRVEDDRSEGLR